MNTNEQMRAALEKIREKCVIYNNDLAEEIDAICGNALALPRRQCDVGTAEEQMRRQHDTMCNTTKACPDSNWSCRECFAKWAQMPYEEEEGDAYGVQSTP